MTGKEFEHHAKSTFGDMATSHDPILQTTSPSVAFGRLAATDYFAILSEMIPPRAGKQPDRAFG